jgi:hypothetical protein
MMHANPSQGVNRPTGPNGLPAAVPVVRLPRPHEQVGVLSWVKRSRARSGPFRQPGATTLRGRRQRFSAWALARLASKAESAAAGGSKRENRGAPTRCNDVARIGQFRRLTRFGNFETTPPTFQGHMGIREQQIILKTDERTIVLELGLGGKFAAKSSGWDENRVLLEGDKLDIEVKAGRWVLTHVPAKPSCPPDGYGTGCVNSGCCPVCGACVSNVPPWPSAVATKLPAM